MSGELPSVNFYGYPQGKSGYGNATINVGLAFSRSRVNTKFVIQKGRELFGAELKSFKGNSKIDFYLCTPPFKRYKSNNYKIGHFYWEANILPKVWAKDIQHSVNELWVPCKLTRAACLKAGFKGPIEVLHTPCDTSPPCSEVEIPSPITNEMVLSDKTFKFYSVFQWNERKGYNELLKAYYKEFDKNDDVILILKVNPINKDASSLAKIKLDILRIKKQINKKNLPNIYLITDHISKGALMGLHRACDAFVLPHHGEGWGMPIHDAMLCDSHLITTKYGGITELLNNDNAFIIDHKIGPVKPVRWTSLYQSYQSWAYPKVESLMGIMRCVFEEREKYKYKLENAKCLAVALDINSCSIRIENILSQKRFKKFL